MQIYQFICVINRKAKPARTLEFVNFEVQVRPQKRPTTYSGIALRAANWCLLGGNSKGKSKKGENRHETWHNPVL